ncbi:MAG: PIG-L family deacetylase [Bacteroidetes bacterium]|nr:PIG-L family deacetylase [Bacteroidota bacterium]MDA0907452.1 PIG-L family deacetylase [Bacteroidota bacterium]
MFLHKLTQPLKKATLLGVAFLLPLLAIAQNPNVGTDDGSDDRLRVIAIFAHPDDADSKMGGTAALMAQMGHAVKFVSITSGDAGHQSQGGGALAKRRRAEAQEAGRRLGIDEYVVLDNHDGELLPELHIRQQVIREIRKWNADVVLGLRPNDYHPDHRYAGVLVQDAAYMVVVPNVTPDTPPLKKNPVFLYMNDRFQKPNPFSHDIVVGIDDVLETKVRGLDAHVSQMYEWLPWVNGTLEDVPETSQERIQWMMDRRTSWSRVSDEQRASMIKWYGEEKGSQFQHAESFEICEYGYQPTEEDIRRIFPMFDQP